MNDKKLDAAAGLLFQAAHMLMMEAEEWRSRKREPSKDWTRNMVGDLADHSWADKCERIAKNNDSAARAMLDLVEKIRMEEAA